jgi:NADH dehydrogenase FAD-containing subunit
MGKHLVLIGGGHAHMVTLARLVEMTGRGHRVTVVQPSAHHYYSGMGPGMLGRTYRPAEIRFATRRVVEKQGGAFIRDSAVVIDAARRRVGLASGREVAYDVLSCNAGSSVPTGLTTSATADEAVFTVKPIEHLQRAQERLAQLTARKTASVVVVGGGPSAAEIAGNAWQLARLEQGHPPRITVVAGRRFMQRFPDAIRRRALSILSSRDIQILEADYVDSIEKGAVTTRSGQSLRADLVFLATGVRPSAIFAASSLPTGPDGGLVVNARLQCPDHPEIFGGGDCIHFQPRPLDKVGVYAVRQNAVLRDNLMAALEDRPLKPFDPGGAYLLIFNLGGGIGIVHKWGLTFGGRAAFVIKDRIDRRFMRRFQAME